MGWSDSLRKRMGTNFGGPHPHIGAPIKTNNTHKNTMYHSPHTRNCSDRRDWRRPATWTLKTHMRWMLTKSNDRFFGSGKLETMYWCETCEHCVARASVAVWITINTVIASDNFDRRHHEFSTIILFDFWFHIMYSHGYIKIRRQQLGWMNAVNCERVNWVTGSWYAYWCLVEYMCEKCADRTLKCDLKEMGKPSKPWNCWWRLKRLFKCNAWPNCISGSNFSASVWTGFLSERKANAQAYSILQSNVLRFSERFCTLYTRNKCSGRGYCYLQRPIIQPKQMSIFMCSIINVVSIPL